MQAHALCSLLLSWPPYRNEKKKGLWHHKESTRAFALDATVTSEKTFRRKKEKQKSSLAGKEANANTQVCRSYASHKKAEKKKLAYFKKTCMFNLALRSYYLPSTRKLCMSV